MGRKERRAAQRQEQREAAELRASGYGQAIIRREAVKQAAIARLSQNGITPQDLEKEFDTGYAEGFRAAAQPVTRGAYAAVCLALKELHGFGTKRCAEVLRAMDKHMQYSLTSEELINEVWEKLGLELVWDDPFDRIQEL